MTTDPKVHHEVGLRLAEQGGRYTVLRHTLVETMAKAGRPLSIAEILDDNPGTSQSSAYRNISVLIEAGVVRRVSGSDDHGRFELSEDVLGHHHHHLVCTACGRVDDLVLPPGLERAFAGPLFELNRGRSAITTWRTAAVAPTGPGGPLTSSRL